ncbi:hypothetical protein F5880DRAFT_1504260 [Lentinula raphanica]|nr:hypothetical protein F5880DRAFT_1504260 [Lentinula raphanica]
MQGNSKENREKDETCPYFIVLLPDLEDQPGILEWTMKINALEVFSIGFRAIPQVPNSVVPIRQILTLSQYSLGVLVPVVSILEGSLTISKTDLVPRLPRDTPQNLSSLKTLNLPEKA